MHYKVAVDPDRHELTVEVLIKGEFGAGESLLLLDNPGWV